MIDDLTPIKIPVSQLDKFNDKLIGHSDLFIVSKLQDDSEQQTPSNHIDKQISYNNLKFDLLNRLKITKISSDVFELYNNFTGPSALLSIDYTFNFHLIKQDERDVFISSDGLYLYYEMDEVFKSYKFTKISVDNLFAESISATRIKTTDLSVENLSANISSMNLEVVNASISNLNVNDANINYLYVYDGKINYVNTIKLSSDNFHTSILSSDKISTEILSTRVVPDNIVIEPDVLTTLLSSSDFIGENGQILYITPDGFVKKPIYKNSDIFICENQDDIDFTLTKETNRPISCYNISNSKLYSYTNSSPNEINVENINEQLGIGQLMKNSKTNKLFYVGSDTITRMFGQLTTSNANTFTLAEECNGVQIKLPSSEN